MAWQYVFKAASILFEFLFSVILARLLEPEDFGLLALGMIVVAFAQTLSTLGIGPAVVQRRMLTRRDIRVASTVAASAGLTMAGIVYVAAPQASTLLGDARAEEVLRWLALKFVLQGLAVVPFSLLRRELDFRRTARIDFLSGLLSYGLVAVPGALLGLGVWSLVGATILRDAAAAVMAYGATRHAIRPLLALRELRQLSHVGSGLSLAGLLHYVALHSDLFFLGRVLGAGSLGIYTRARSVVELPTVKLVAGGSQVLLSALSRIQDEPSALRHAYMRGMAIAYFCILPVCALILVLAHEIVVGIYGPKWAAAIMPLRVLALFGFLRTACGLTAVFLIARAQTLQLACIYAVQALVAAVGSWIAVERWGTTGVAFVMGLGFCVVWIILTVLVSRELSLSTADLARSIRPGACLSVSFAVGALAARTLGALLGWGPVAALGLSCILSAMLGTLSVIMAPAWVFDGVPAVIWRESRQALASFVAAAQGLAR